VTVQDGHAVGVGDGRAQLRDRLALADIEHLDLGGDLVPGSDGREEPPPHFQEDAPGAGQILGDNRVQKSARHAALHDDPAEAARSGDRLVVVERVPVARDLGEELDAACGDHARPARRVADARHQKISGHQGARVVAKIASARAAAPRRNSSIRPPRTSCVKVKPPR
jgi:hypothetical protein